MLQTAVVNIDEVPRTNEMIREIQWISIYSLQNSMEGMHKHE